MSLYDEIKEDLQFGISGFGESIILTVDGTSYTLDALPSGYSSAYETDRTDHMDERISFRVTLPPGCRRPIYKDKVTYKSEDWSVIDTTSAMGLDFIKINCHRKNPLHILASGKK